MSETDRFFSNQNMKLLCRDTACSVYQVKNETGDGTATYYQVFPGIYVLYNDFHIANCPARKFEEEHIIGIHHCREGRIEWEIADGAYLYLSAGDTLLESSAIENRQCSFPLSHYHGITVAIIVPKAKDTLAELFKLISVDLSKLEEKFALDRQPFALHGDSFSDHIFFELYQVPESIRTEYLRIKVLELLVSMKAIDIDTIGESRLYFYKTQVEKIKAIMKLMTENPEQHYTMEELSKRYDISTSALKQCFKGVYGTAIYTYMRNYRMDLAATLLTQTDEPITMIAGKVGYTNTSKFSAAFKSAKGKTTFRISES